MNVKEAPSLPEEKIIERGHELDYLSRRSLFLSVVSLVMLGALAILLAYGLSIYLTSGMVEDREGRPVPSAQTPNVRVTADQPDQLRELRESEETRLNNYGWIIEPEGIGRIPIERAMELIAKKGWPAPKPNSENKQNPPKTPNAETQPNAEEPNDNSNR